MNKLYAIAWVVFLTPIFSFAQTDLSSLREIEDGSAFLGGRVLDRKTKEEIRLVCIEERDSICVWFKTLLVARNENDGFTFEDESEPMLEQDLDRTEEFLVHYATELSDVDFFKLTHNLQAARRAFHKEGLVFAVPLTAAIDFLISPYRLIQKISNRRVRKKYGKINDVLLSDDDSETLRFTHKDFQRIRHVMGFGI